jgi:SAM-dependent methyltransferase
MPHSSQSGSSVFTAQPADDDRAVARREALSRARPVPCPLCDADDAAIRFETHDSTFEFEGRFTVVRCRACGMQYTNPQVSPADVHLYYPEDYSAHAPDRADTHAQSRGRDVWDRLPEIGGRRLLDVGCGSGAYLARQRAGGWHVTGVEPSERGARAARDLDMPIHHGTLCDADLTPASFDVITMLGVLDHIPDPLPTLKRARALLAPDGQLIILVPNADSAAARWFGPLWPGWDLPRHQNHFTFDTLRDMLDRAGLNRVRFSGKRRTSRWRRGGALKAQASRSPIWRILGPRRSLWRWASAIAANGRNADEIVAVGENA